MSGAVPQPGVTLPYSELSGFRMLPNLVTNASEFSLVIRNFSVPVINIFPRVRQMGREDLRKEVQTLGKWNRRLQ